MKIEEKTRTSEIINLDEACRILSISTATGRNWVRLGKLTSYNENCEFCREYIEELHSRLINGQDGRLKSRRNKKKLGGRQLYRDYIQSTHNHRAVEELMERNEALNEAELRIALAIFALQLYHDSRGIETDEKLLLMELMEEQSAEVQHSLCDISSEDSFCRLVKELVSFDGCDVELVTETGQIMETPMKFTGGEDALGFAYISLRDIGGRKQVGAYYTPDRTVQLMLDNLEKKVVISDCSICDPCCGTGNFIMGLLTRGVEADSLYGRDIDEISVIITRINVMLLRPDVDIELLHRNFLCGDSLLENFQRKFDVILGNPPWGSEFDCGQIPTLLQRYETASKKGMEAGAVFTERAMELVEEGGVISFVLPQAIMTVYSHTRLRKLIMQKYSFLYAAYIGDAFAGVQCPSVILGLCCSEPGKTSGCRILCGERSFTIEKDRALSQEGFLLHISDAEEDCLRNICNVNNKAYLRDNATFALGIVTGNNRELISHEKTQGREVILRGRDIRRYSIVEPDSYIEFNPAGFQQTAPEEVYRSPEKLIYRFISKAPVVAYDDRKRLSLNSCNVLIPRIKGMEIKYVMALLNSSVAGFFLSKKFDSLKVLRHHLESVPLPVADRQTQEEIIALVEELMKEPDNEHIYDELDRRIMKLYGLGEKDRAIICEYRNERKGYSSR